MPSLDLHTIKIVLILTIPFFVGTIWAVVNAVQKEFATMGQKALWVIVAGIPFIGFIIYFLLGARKGHISKESAVE